MNFFIGIYSCPMDPMDSMGTTSYPLIQHERNFSESITNIKKELFHRNLFVSNGSDGLHGNAFLPPHPT